MASNLPESERSHASRSHSAETDKVCDEFQAAWRAGQGPSIEEYLAQLPEAPELFDRLLGLDLDLRFTAGEQPTPAEYVSRFPVCEHQIAAVFARMAAAAESGRQSVDSTLGRPSALHIRCPHCQNPIELVEDNELEEITCLSCGSKFALAVDETLDYQPGTETEARRRTIGHFKLIERLGVGGFGAVWKAHDTKLDRIVAVKIPRKSNIDREETEKFLREARTAAQLQHSNIVSVHEVGLEDDTIFIVSDFVEGTSLDKWLASHRLNHPESAGLCIKIAAALHYAHEHGVIHRDLKPANIMLDTAGEPHIMDFGLAKREAGEITVTVEGAILGTPAYMSPEQAQGKAHEVDRRTDVYSLGVVLFELLTGERPFRGDVRMLLKQVAEDDPPSLRKMDGHISRDLETICLKCLEKEARRRYVSTDVVRSELGRFLKGEPIQARPIGAFRRSWRWCQRRPMSAAAIASSIALLLTLAIGGLTVAVQQAKYAREQIRLTGEATEAKGAAAKAAEDEKHHRQRAERRLRRAQSLHLAAVSDSQRLTDPEASLLLAVESAHATALHGEPILSQTRRSLIESLSTIGGHPLPHSAHWQIEATRDNHWVITRDYESRTLRFWRILETGTVEETAAAPDYVSDFALVQDSNRLIAVNRQDSVYVWDLDDESTFQSPTILKWPLPEPSDSPRFRVSPDGNWIVLLGGRASVVWDLSDDVQAEHRVGLPGYSNNMVFHPDGHSLITSTSGMILRESGGLIRIWDLDGNDLENPVREWRTDEGHVTGLAISSDGKWLVSTSHSETPRLWCLDDDNPRESRVFLEGHTKAATECVIAPGDNWLVTFGSDEFALLWKLNDTESPSSFRLNGHTGHILRAAFSENGDRLLTAGQDGSIRIWDLHQMVSGTLASPKATLTGHEAGGDMQLSDARSINSAFFMGDDRYVISGGYDQTVRVWDLDSPDPSETQQVLRGHSKPIGAVIAFDRGNWLASRSIDGRIRLWDFRRRRFSQIPETILPGAYNHIAGRDVGVGFQTLAVSPTGRWGAIGTRNSVSVWDLDDVLSDKPMFTLKDRLVSGLQFVSKSRLLVKEPNRCLLYDISGSVSDQPVNTWKTSSRALVFAVFKNGKRIAIADPRGPVELWDLENAPELVAALPHSGAVLRMEFSPDGNWLATAGKDDVFLWCLDAEDPSTSAISLRHGNALSMDWSDDGSVLAAGSLKGRISVWDLRVKNPLANRTVYDQTEDGFHNPVSSLAISPDGVLLASGGVDMKVRIWNLGDKDSAPRMLEGHQSGVAAILFANDGRTLASISDMRLGGRGSEVRIWRPEAQQPELVLPLGRALSVSASEDLRLFAALDESRIVKVWHVDDSALIKRAQLTAGRSLTAVERLRFSLGEDGEVEYPDSSKTKASAAPFEESFSLQLDEILNTQLEEKREGQRRLDRVGHLVTLGEALQRYRDMHKTFPASSIVGPDGKTLHSWRIALLPILGLRTLYNEYRLDEAWDSKHNKELLDKMPDVLRCPLDVNNTTEASYFSVAGKDPTRGVRIPYVIDGTSNTIMLIETKKGVPWTKPEDIVFVRDQSLPALPPFEGDGVFVCRYDGAVIFIDSKIDPTNFRAMLTIDGLEPVVQPTQFYPPSRAQ